MPDLRRNRQAARQTLPNLWRNGNTNRSRTIDVKIPAGVQDGTRVRVAGKGAPGHQGGKAGDLYLLVHIESHPTFQRQGSDLLAQLPIWPWEAILGADVLVPTLTDPVRAKIPPGSRAGSKLRLKGKGLPTAAGGHGDLFFTLQIVLPPSLTDEDRKLYEELARARIRTRESNCCARPGAPRETSHGKW